MLYTLSVAPYMLNPFPGSEKNIVIFKLWTEIIIDVLNKY